MFPVDSFENFLVYYRFNFRNNAQEALSLPCLEISVHWPKEYIPKKKEVFMAELFIQYLLLTGANQFESE
jgi:hypothetical protein